MTSQKIPSWLKNRGYIHITPRIDVFAKSKKIISKITNKEYVAKYPFFPLIHASIKERRYKPNPSGERCHSYQEKNGAFKKQTKSRPLHYASHMDALIFGYYADDLQRKYETRLLENPSLSECIIAYRKIPENSGLKNKSTIHFAHEVFEEIKKRGNEKDCIVLKFDIESFFSNLNHALLKRTWSNLIHEETLPDDHYNVFKAATRFSYILLDDLRIKKNKYGRKAGFDEKRLAQIRNKYGVQSYFQSAEEFRNKVKSRELTIYRFPFIDKKSKIPIGIPQGLPISAVLANLYLLEFDTQIFNKIVEGLGGFYRRYSDDMIIICDPQKATQAESILKAELEKSLVTLSKNKTERFLFRKMILGKKSPRLTAIKLTEELCIIESPFSYLGFEFYGTKTLIKSSNLAKFYRRMFASVKKKANLALKIAKNDGKPPVVFKKRLYMLYQNTDLKKVKIFSRHKFLIKNHLGEFRIKSIKRQKDQRSNYFSYVKRASLLLNEDAIKGQIRKHRVLFNQALSRHLKRKRL